MGRIMLRKYDISDVAAKSETVMVTSLPCSTYADFENFGLEQSLTGRDFRSQNACDVPPVVLLPSRCIHAHAGSVNVA